jgi:transcriptional regulator with XRE-family HTH domain
MEASKAFGLAIRKLRIARDLTQEELGFESELTRAYISSIELDQKLPSITTIEKLAKAFDLSLSELMKLVEIEIKNK